MYIHDVHIQNIRSIEDFRMHFDNPAGWHVIIGDNGSGKTTIARAITLALLGDHTRALWENWANWRRQGTSQNKIVLRIRGENERYDSRTTSGRKGSPNIYNQIDFNNEDIVLVKTNPDPRSYNWGSGYGWFSCAFGAFRRFTGGDITKEKLYYTHQKLGAHLSAFGEDVALSEAIPFLKSLHIRKLENPADTSLDLVLKFINEGKLLPYGTQIKKVTYDDIFFIDGNGQEVTVLEMSDGYRSILSLTLELIRQLVRVYGLDTVFEHVKNGENVIKTPGVVIIDEIDAHLHPTWQVRVGEWFLKYFPALQFIVTTHSPLICRAAHTGTIWRLASPASDRPSGEVTGTEKDRLVYGNILDAYGTDVFGEGVERSEEGRVLLHKLARLNQKEIYGENGLTEEEKKELTRLKQIFQTDATFDF